jgi:hypothetical protein
MNGAMKSKADKLSVGLIPGLILPALLMVIYWQANYGYMDLQKFIQFTSIGQIHVKLISLFTVVNLGLFFFFIWRNHNLAARGVLGATFFYTLCVIFIKFLSGN